MHDKHSHSRSELWLGRQLRDGAREQPQFSEELHQRIMQAVRPTAGELESVEPAPMRDSTPRRRAAYWRSATWLTAAAAIFAMVMAARWFIGAESHDGSQPPQSAVVRSVGVQPGPDVKPAIDAVASKQVTSNPDEAVPEDVKPTQIASLTANYTLDDLTRDAQATAHVLVDQLPFETPADEWGL